MVCLALAIAIGINQDRESKPLFPQLFPNPTGQNALEFYIQASDLADRHGIELWNPPYDDNRPDDVFPGVEEMARRTVDLIGLVRAGNNHPYLIPPKGVGPRAHLAIMKVARLLRQYARVEFARGRPDTGTDVYLLLIEMSKRMYNVGAVSEELHASVQTLSVMHDFSRLYMSLSLNGAEDILQRVPMPRDPTFGERWQEETARIKATIDDPSLWIHTGFAGGPYERMSDVDRVKAQGQWDRLAQSVAADLAGFTIESEAEWATMALRMKQYGAQVAAPLAPMVGMEHLYTIVLRAIRYRTTLRLLRVHALIATYRWRQEALPDSLEDLPVEAHLDPGTGKPYVYLRLTESAYDLYSAGNSWHGAIGLRESWDSPRVDGGPPISIAPRTSVSTYQR